MLYKLIAQLLILYAVLYEIEAANPLRSFVKLTNLKCRATNPHLMSFEVCRIERSENVTKAMTLCHIYEKPLERLRVRLRCFRKRPTGYVPFVVNLNLDWCDFLEKRNNEVMQGMFSIFEQFSNLNTKCPINIDYTYMNMTLSKGAGFHLPFKFPSGDYRVDITINANTAIQLIVNAYFQIDY